MDKLHTGIIQILLTILIIAVIFYFSNDLESLSNYGYAGVFLIALFSSATILLPAPGWTAVVAMSPYLDPLLLGLAAGIGSAIGELTAYVAGNGASSILNNNLEAKKIVKLIKKYDLVGIFILAFIPNPLFDIAGIVAGSLKINWLRYLFACALGRILRYVLLAMLGAFTLSLL